MAAALLNLISVSPAFIRAYQLAELRAVIPEMVYADGVISEKIEYFIERAAQNGGSQMTDVKGLCYINRGIVDAHRFTCADR